MPRKIFPKENRGRKLPLKKFLPKIPPPLKKKKCSPNPKKKKKKIGEKFCETFSVSAPRY